MDNKYSTEQLGDFIVDNGAVIQGSLHIQEDDSQLTLRSNENFSSSSSTITGELYNHEKVTLIRCIQHGTGSSTRNNKSYYHSKIFAHYIAKGDSHLEPNNETINQIEINIEHAKEIFYEYRSFGAFRCDAETLNSVLKEQKLPKEITIGETPIIAYFSGKTEITKTHTEIGTIKALHMPFYTMGSADGAKIENSIIIRIEFTKLHSLENALALSLNLINFLRLISGSAHKITSIRTKNNSDEHHSIHWSLLANAKNTKPPHPGDMLASPTMCEEEFSKILSNWISTNNDRLNSRGQLFENLRDSREYSANRLVAAANLFDILPPSAFPTDPPLADELLDAKIKCTEIFKSLKNSSERDSILSALGRLGKSSLKNKARHRLKIILDNSPKAIEIFTDLDKAIEEAINTRNYYVHGTHPKIKPEHTFEILDFLTTTLEFVYGMSELVECGLNMERWSLHPATMHHPYFEYRNNYKPRIKQLLDLLEKKSDQIT
jgi:hypothetical protein